MIREVRELKEEVEGERRALVRFLSDMEKYPKAAREMANGRYLLISTGGMSVKLLGPGEKPSWGRKPHDWSFESGVSVLISENEEDMFRQVFARLDIDKRVLRAFARHEAMQRRLKKS